MTRYHVSIAGTTHVVTIEHGCVVSLDGHRLDATLERIDGTEVRALRIGNTVRRLIAHPYGADEWQIDLPRGRVLVEAIDDRTKMIRSMTGGAEGARQETDLRAPMPGLVIEVAVSVGDSVKRGDPLAIVEAMKMENELAAPADGTVASVSVKTGDTVEKNQVLIELTSVSAEEKNGD